MRYIPILEKKTRPPKEWCKKADQLTRALKKEKDPAKRLALINENKAHWGKLKQWLLNLSLGKCWFSEARDCVQYWEVEHFRPKGPAKDRRGRVVHEGYWWRAFDWENYRIAGQVVNRKKGAYFPLRNGSFIADAPGRPCEDESPYLLDPADEDDCSLVFFDETGQVRPKPGATPWERARVALSCERYNLDVQALIDGRKALWTTCRDLMSEYLNLMKEHCQTGSASKRGQAKKVLRQLQTYVGSKEPFSSVATACLVASNEKPIIRAVMHATQR